MNLIIDVGNTRNKIAVFDDGQMLYQDVYTSSEVKEALLYITVHFPKVDRCIISASGKLNENDLALLKREYKVHELSHKSNIPFENLYATPTTLGVDRIALIAGAALKFPKNNVLVIDAGSAITYDFLNSENEYLGGAISPGLFMRYKALNEFTANLPLLKSEFPKTFVGNSTNNAIHVGVILGTIDEIDGAISRYKEQYADLTIILTGGDTDFLRDRLKNDIFANSKFLLEGLNYILEQNND